MFKKPSKLELDGIRQMMDTQPLFLSEEPRIDKLTEIHLKSGEHYIIVSDEFTFKDDKIIFRNKDKNVCLFHYREIRRVI